METTVDWFPVQDCFCSCWQYFNVVFFYSMHGVVPFGALNDKEYWFRVWEISSNSAGLLRVRTAARKDVASPHEAGADLWSVPLLSLGDIYCRLVCMFCSANSFQNHNVDAADSQCSVGSFTNLHEKSISLCFVVLLMRSVTQMSTL